MGDKKEREKQSARDETEAERLDRNYIEVLQELRVVQAGMQILFGFLLSLAFQSRFVDVTDFDRAVYLVTLVCASIATACMIAPVPFHRIVFRRGMKGDLLVATTRYAAIGLTFLFLSMVGAVLLVLDFLFDPVTAFTISGVLALVFAMLWLVIPVLSRAEEDDSSRDDIDT